MKKAYIHPTALVETKEIGEGTSIWAYTHIMDGAHIGKNCNIGDHCFIERGSFIDDNVTVKNANMIWEAVTIEKGVFVGPCVLFTNDLYPRSKRLQQAQKRYQRKEDWLVPTLVKRGASLGAGAVLLAGVTIGEYALVAAGAVVTKDIPPYTIVKGNPSRSSGWICECGRPLYFNKYFAHCQECGLQYREQNGTIRVVKNEARRR